MGRNKGSKNFGKNGATIICKTCSKEFYVPKCRKETAHFCSYKCSGTNTFSNLSITRKCRTCGKDFIIRPKSGKAQVYCSPKCRIDGNYQRYFSSKKMICEQCSKKFTINKGQSYQTKFCSKGCRWDAREQKTGITIGNRNGVKRYFARKGFIKKCEECGYDIHPEVLGIHHKDLNPKNHSLDNLSVLCPTCHSLKHRRHMIN